MKYLFVKCSLPNCFNKVGYHSRKGNTQDGIRYKFKSVCNKHRETQKKITDDWKLQRGCANKDGHYGFACTTGAILDPGVLHINHKDGNNLNREESNIEVLCGNCHHLVSKTQNHHLNQYDRFPSFGNTGLFTGLFEEVDKIEISVYNNDISLSG